MGVAERVENIRAPADFRVHLLLSQDNGTGHTCHPCTGSKIASGSVCGAHGLLHVQACQPHVWSHRGSVGLVLSGDLLVPLFLQRPHLLQLHGVHAHHGRARDVAVASFPPHLARRRSCGSGPRLGSGVRGDATHRADSLDAAGAQGDVHISESWTLGLAASPTSWVCCVWAGCRRGLCCVRAVGVCAVELFRVQRAPRGRRALRLAPLALVSLSGNPFCHSHPLAISASWHMASKLAWAKALRLARRLVRRCAQLHPSQGVPLLAACVAAASDVRRAGVGHRPARLDQSQRSRRGLAASILEPKSAPVGNSDHSSSRRALPVGSTPARVLGGDALSSKRSGEWEGARRRDFVSDSVPRHAVLYPHSQTSADAVSGLHASRSGG
mmetsp:Transcript_43448/g.82911  ORF Transcript_43448/g.82911 Transcript_43448/m.82911 type:complete len:384 (-) Transcript_43448:510-1661(-)